GGGGRGGEEGDGVGRERVEGTDGHRRAVVREQVWKDEEVAVGVCDARRAGLTQARDQPGTYALDLGLRRFAVDRDPARDGAAAEIDVVRAAMAVAERLAYAVSGQEMSLLGTLHLDARVPEVGEPRGVHADQVIVVEAVLRQHFPVGAYIVVLRALDDLHLPGGRLVDDDVYVFLRAGEVVRKRHRVRVEVEEYEAAVARDPGRLLQGEIAFPEARRIGVLPGHRIELTVPVVAPTMVETGVVLRVALGLSADDASAVKAGVEKHAHVVPAVAAEDDRPVADD